jgi:hypothetical protein
MDWLETTCYCNKKEQNKTLLDLDKLERLEKILKDSKQENKNDKGE